MRACYWTNGHYADPDDPQTNFVNATTIPEKIFVSRAGRVVKQVRKGLRGPKFQIQNRELDSILRKRDWLDTGKKKVEELRKEAEEKALYSRAWGLINSKFIGKPFNIDRFFQQEHKVKEFLLIKHEINMRAHIKDGARMMFFEPTRYYKSMRNKTAEQREVEYNQRIERMANQNVRLNYLTEKRTWNFYLYQAENSHRLQLILTSNTFQNLKKNRKLKGYFRPLGEFRGFYRNIRGVEGKRLLQKYNGVRTITTILPDDDDE